MPTMMPRTTIPMMEGRTMASCAEWVSVGRREDEERTWV